MDAISAVYHTLDRFVHSNIPVPPLGFEMVAREALGVPLGALRFALGFVFSVLAGAVHGKLPYGTARHLWATFSGLVILFYPFGLAILRIFIPALLIYIFMAIDRKRCGLAAWLIAFPTLLWCHVGQASGLAWKAGEVDNTGAAMVLTLKVISIAYNYQLGRKPENQWSEDDRKYALRRLPSLLQFLGYLLCCGNLLAGPTFEFNDYLNFSSGEGEFSALKGKGAPSAFLPTLTKFLLSFVHLGFHLGIDSKYPVVYLERPEFMQPSPSWDLPRRAFLYWLVCQGARFKYYFAWTMGDAALTASGFGFSGFSEDQGRGNRGRAALFDRHVNVKPLAVDLSTSGRDLTKNWNAKTGVWLRRYVYDQLGASKSGVLRRYRLLWTQLITGLWHGLFAGYWFFFVSTYFFFESSTITYKYYQWLGRGAVKYPMALLLILLTNLQLNYIAAPFITLELHTSWNLIKNVYFYGHLIMFAVMALGKIAPPPKVAKTPQQGAGRTAGANGNGNGTAAGRNIAEVKKEK